MCLFLNLSMSMHELQASVILTTHFCYHYSMWDFTHMCIPNNLSLICKSSSLCGPWTSHTHSPLPKWAFSFTSVSFMSLHVNLTSRRHYCLAPLTNILCWVFFQYRQDRLCGLYGLSLCPIYYLYLFFLSLFNIRLHSHVYT